MPSDSPLSLSLSLCQFKAFSYIFTAAALAFSWVGLAVTEKIKLIKLTFIFCHLAFVALTIVVLGFLIPGIAKWPTPDCSAL